MPNGGIVALESKRPFVETVDRLLSVFAKRGIEIFATIDHEGAARAAGLLMPPATVIVFGNPKAGTPVMLANLGAALDLPLKVLVSRPELGRVEVSYTTAEEIGRRHALPAELVARLAYAEQIIAEAVR